MAKLAKILSSGVLIIALVVVTLASFLSGYVKGYEKGKNNQQAADQKYLSQFVSATTAPAATSTPVPEKTKVVYVTPAPVPSWGGPQLWDAVNKRRVELGVNPLTAKDNLCTIASIRLNELLSLGTLDGHQGFSALEERSDIKPIFESYSAVAEFLVSGATSPQNAVDLWENTLGHRELLSGGQFVWGCIYAQNGFGVAIAAY